MNLISLGIFAIMFLALLAIVTNVGEDSQERIQNQMFLMNCPPPIYDGVVNATAPGTTIDGFAFVYDENEVIHNGNGTVIRCTITPLTPFPAFQVFMTEKNYQEVTLGFPSGWFSYMGDFMGSYMQRIIKVFELIGYFVTPTNFNILGYTLTDLSLIPLAMVIALYAFCYIGIGILIYKVVSPFSGV